MVTVVAPQVESFLFASLPGLRTISITDGGGGPFAFTLTADATVGDALEDWAGQANAHGTLSETYTFDWSASSQQVRFAATGNFTLAFSGSLPTALGFHATSYTGASLHASDQVALGIANPLNIDYDAPWTDEETVLTKRRWGRVSGRVHYQMPLTRLTVMMESGQADTLLAGPLLTAKARYWPCGFTSGVYATDNLRGYLDVFPYQFEDVRKIGVGDGHTEAITLGSVDL